MTAKNPHEGSETQIFCRNILDLFADLNAHIYREVKQGNEPLLVLRRESASKSLEVYAPVTSSVQKFRVGFYQKGSCEPTLGRRTYKGQLLIDRRFLREVQRKRALKMKIFKIDDK